MMKGEIEEKQFKMLTTPRAAAIAGILFGVLFAASLILLRTSIPDNLSAGTDWVEQGAGRITIALSLMPYAGIAYLWFIGVLRDRLGQFEDRFFSTVFFGSSLLFLGMVFISMAIIGGILASYRLGPDKTLHEDVIYFGRAIMLQISNIYALRMAGVSMISLGTIWLRTGLMPKWLALISYLLALTLLLIINLNLWVALVFPVWVFMISVLILTGNVKKTA